MTVSLTPLARQQFNQGGVPLAGGKLFTYAAGSVATKLATYTDSTGGTPNTNPIVLDSNGQCDIWLTDGSAYKFVLSPSTDTDPPTNPYWSEDNISNNIIPFNPTFHNVTVSGTLAVTGNSTFTGTVNKITITQPATGATLTIIDGKTATVSNTLTFTGTDGSSAAFGAGGTVAYKGTSLAQFAATTSAELAGVISDETGTGKLVFATDPTFILSDVTTNNVSATARGWCPKFPNNTTTFFRGDGTYAAVPGIAVTISSRTSNTILASGDNGTLINITSGTFTQTLTAAATLGSGWFCYYRNIGTGVVTIGPSQNIDGLASFAMYQNECRLVQCDGAVFTSEVIHPFYAKFASTGTFVMPPGYIEVEVDAVGGGGGGGSGCRDAAGTNRGGGGPGGSPARVVRKFRNIAAGTSITVTIGAGGTGGVAQTVNTTAGNNGVTGGNTTFGTLMTAYGGIRGIGAPQGSSGQSGFATGSGSASAGTSATTPAAIGGLPSQSGLYGSDTSIGTDNIGEGGGGAGSNVSGNSMWGGAGACAYGSPSAAATRAGASSLYGVSAATAGGSIDSGDVLYSPARAGLNGTYTLGGGALPGTSSGSPTAGANGAAAPTDDVCGNPGAGGGSSKTAAAAKGGDGGLPGGSGGGGGASLNGNNSGAGGLGANGQCIVKGIV